MKLTIREQTCTLLTDRALFWEEEAALILADVHIGKDTFLRKLGIPVPQGSLQKDLRLISKLVEEKKAKKCLIIGDLIHAPAGLSPEVVALCAEWMQKLPASLHLILGNHDVYLNKNLPSSWPITLHDDLLIAPFYFSHFPVNHPTCFVWAGHLHPKVTLKSSTDKLVFPCFQIFSHLGILPAFSCLVAGSLIQAGEDSALYAIAGAKIVKVEQNLKVHQN